MPATHLSSHDPDRTKILLSFAMAGAGGLFGTWLRDRLMKQFGWAGTREVYLDNIVMRDHLDDHLPAGHRTVLAPDTRFRESHGITYIGARNPLWNEHYLRAMGEAHTMIFTLTEAWLGSVWCGKEWAQFINESERRPRDRPLRGIILKFPLDKHDAIWGAVRGHGGRDVHVLPVTRVRAGRGSVWDAIRGRGVAPQLTWSREAWVIGEGDFHQLVQLLEQRR